MFLFLFVMLPAIIVVGALILYIGHVILRSVIIPNWIVYDKFEKVSGILMLVILVIGALLLIVPPNYIAIHLKTISLLELFMLY